MQSLLMNYIIKSMLESRHLDNNSIHCLLLEKLVFKQQLNVKESIIDANNRLTGFFSHLSLLVVNFHLEID